MDKIMDSCDHCLEQIKFTYIYVSYIGKFCNPIFYHNIQCYGITCYCSSSLEQVSSFKYLGVILDEKISWKLQVSKYSTYN